ncbi:MAG: TIGR03790 family protein, partial [Armatimonadetes bacterium]|nr:TIGR03790 family protein [Armatimonadota bacterium]
AEAAEMADLERRLPELRRAANTAETAWARAAGNETTSSLEGELALLAWPPYDAYRWVYNALHFGFSDAQRQQAPPVYLTARLDAPDPEQAKRLVSDAVRAEREGLKGTFYLDARGIALKADQPDWYGYGGYDQSLRDLAEVLKTQTTLPVVLDDKPELFAAGGCPEAALYCGWYKLANYVDAFDWAPGAVAYHIASAEATTLRNPSSQVWCKKLLEDGVAATLGPVAEPYTVGFPKPYEFFVTLLSGRYTLVETYYRTLMLNSWMTTLIGDPLYNPFGARPVLSEELLRLSPPGAPALWAQP